MHRRSSTPTKLHTTKRHLRFVVLDAWIAIDHACKQVNAPSLRRALRAAGSRALRNTEHCSLERATTGAAESHLHIDPDSTVSCRRTCKTPFVCGILLRSTNQQPCTGGVASHAPIAISALATLGWLWPTKVHKHTPRTFTVTRSNL